MKYLLLLIGGFFLFSRALCALGDIGPLEIKFVYKKAIRLLKSGEYVKAKSELLKILKVNPYLWEVYANLGYTFEKLLDYKEAKHAYQKALDLLPAKTTPDFLENNLINVSLKLGDNPSEWAEKIKRLFLKYKYNSAILDTYGYWLYLEKDDNAQNILLKAIRFGSDNYTAYYHLGLFYFWKGNYNNAKIYFRRAIEDANIYDREAVFFQYYLYLTLRKLNEKDKALKVWSKFVLPVLDKIVKNRQFLTRVGYKKFYQLVKEDLLCQLRLNFFSGFYLLLRKRRDQKLVMDVPIQLKDIEDFYLFKGLKKDSFLYDNNNCQYKVDDKGNVYCKKHGYLLKSDMDVSNFLLDFYQQEDAYNNVIQNLVSLLQIKEKKKILIQKEKKNEN
jgi:type IV pilus assembly protein PilF